MLCMAQTFKTIPLLQYYKPTHEWLHHKVTIPLNNSIVHVISEYRHLFISNIFFHGYNFYSVISLYMYVHCEIILRFLFSRICQNHDEVEECVYNGGRWQLRRWYHQHPSMTKIFPNSYYTIRKNATVHTFFVFFLKCNYFYIVNDTTLLCKK